MNNNTAAIETTVNVHDQRLDAITANDSDTTAPVDLEAGTTIGGKSLADAQVSTSNITDPGTPCATAGDFYFDLGATPAICVCLNAATDNWACVALTD